MAKLREAIDVLGKRGSGWCWRPRQMTGKEGELPGNPGPKQPHRVVSGAGLVCAVAHTAAAVVWGKGHQVHCATTRVPRDPSGRTGALRKNEEALHAEIHGGAAAQ